MMTESVREAVRRATLNKADAERTATPPPGVEPNKHHRWYAALAAHYGRTAEILEPVLALLEAEDERWIRERDAVDASE